MALDNYDYSNLNIEHSSDSSQDSETKKKMNKKIASSILVSAILSTSGFLFTPFIKSEGATFFILPSIGNFRVGDNFSVSFKINSGGTSINAAEASFNFPAGILEITGISKSGSNFSFWPLEPNWSESGVIHFAGGTATPLSGSAGHLLTVNFKAKQEGEARLVFASGRILAADGQGTDIFAGSGSGFYAIAPVVSVPKKEIPTEILPQEPLEEPSLTAPVSEIEEEVKEVIKTIEKPRDFFEIGTWGISFANFLMFFILLFIISGLLFFLKTRALKNELKRFEKIIEEEIKDIEKEIHK